MKRRSLLIGTALAAATAPRSSWGQDGAWPARPVRLIVPYPPGGSTDGMARIIAPRLQEALGRPFQVENKGGQGGGTGAVEAAKSVPDGYTWLFCYDSQAINETLIRLPIRTMDAFAPAAIVAAGPLVLVASSGSGFKTWQDVVSAAKDKPGEVVYSSAAGGLSRVAAAMLLKDAGITMNHVGYRGGAPALADVVANKIPLLLTNLALVRDAIRDGRLQPLGVTSAEESKHLPGVKSFAQMGVTGFEALTWWGLLAPKRTPDAIINRMSEAVNTVLKEPELGQLVNAQGADVRGGSPQQAAAFMAAEIDRWGQVIQENDIKSEG